MGVKLNYIPMVTNSLKLNPFTHRAARHVVQLQIMLDVNYCYLMNMCNDYYKHIYDRNHANTSSKIYCFVNTHGCNIINDGTY